MKEESPPHGGVRGVTIDGSGRDENYGMEHTRSRMVLIMLDGFAGVSALIGMAMLLTDWPVHFPVGWLQHTPFSNYTLPALILGLIVGGSALVAMATVISRASVGAALSLIAGAIMIGWIVGEVRLIDSVTPSSAYWLQAEYLLVGVAMVALALRVAPGGWRGMVHRFLHRQQRAMGAMAHR